MLRLRAPIMAQPRHIYDLADELLSEILSFLLEPAPRALNGGFNGNGHTSRPGDQHVEVSDLDQFRLVCKRFMRIGTPYKFNRFTLRFSEHGFRRLDELVDMQLAYYVKTITYMVRPFYRGSGTSSSISHIEASKLTKSKIQVGPGHCEHWGQRIPKYPNCTAADCVNKPI
jgi:hypothetical protein